MALADQSLSALNNLKTREEMVADAIRKAILTGRFKPGEKLDQQDLADSLGVSRSPIREALRTLAAEELVTNFAHRGVVVTARTKAELEELLFMRMMLEGAAARRGAEAMSAEQVKLLEQIVIAGEASNDTQELLQLNNDFHNTIYEAFDQPVLVAHIQQLRNKIAPYNRVYLELEGRKEQAWSDHRRIYQACAKGDGAAAEVETRKHLEQVFEGILQTNQ
ncbi:MAG: GntR family transcriptional regulator [Chloroflexota bacterium]